MWPETPRNLWKQFVTLMHIQGDLIEHHTANNKGFLPLFKKKKDKGLREVK